MRLGVVANVYRPGFEEAIGELAEWSKRQSQDVVFEAALQPHCPDGVRTGTAEQVVAESEVIVALGGDGTMLRAARLVGARELPILGVNLGSLGFLTQVVPGQLGEVLPLLASGDYLTERRSTLRVRDEQNRSEHIAFNEVSIDRGTVARAIELRFELDGRLVCRYVADGLIVATPTGSTAYALSAGGPVCHPGLHGILVTPVAPHSLAQRPVVFPDLVTLRITNEEPHAEAAMTIDGQRVGMLSYEHSCTVQRADVALQLVRFPDQDYFEFVRTKLHWGVDPRHAHRDGLV